MAIREKEKFLVFGSPEIKQAEIDEVTDCLRSGWLGTGPKVARFERSFKDYKGASFAVALNSCTAALHLSLIAAGIKAGDEVITTPLTFCATVNAIIHSGATPVLADIDPVTMNISPLSIEKKVTSKTKAIIPVHFAGLACEMEAIVKLADKHNLKIIEDCAHAIETEYRGQKAGTFGEMGCFSFYVTKNIATGEGGMIITENENIAKRLKILALHGMSCDAWRRFSDDGYKHYMVTEVGFKYNMMDIQAAIGIHQLERVETCWQRRQEIWHMYNEALSELEVTLPVDAPDYSRHGYHLYPILVDEKRCGIARDDLLVSMNKNNIGVGVHYLSIPEHPFYQNTFGWKIEDYPNAVKIGRQTLSLPISPKLTNDDIQDVVKAVKEGLGK
ncbi:MAG: DegT/DnrJ/EryC1/StrS family aminotransferase [Lentisphaeraceae bacterium]|nr:DegT/DnrJ/EryC1/StrS family aminotransferase [Lentisphaeraceae bacterium]